MKKLFLFSYDILENKNITYISSEDLFDILQNFVEKYASKGVCFADQMKIPKSEVIDVSSQIEKVILENNIILKENEKLSANENSLRRLAFEMMRSRCIRGKELRTSFKQLDKVYHLDDTETKEALKDKNQLPKPLCCVPSCKCAELLMRDMIKSFPSLIKTKLDKFVVELEVLDKIVINQLLRPSSGSSSSQLRKKISRRPLVVKRSQKIEKDIMKQFLENLIASKECTNITYQTLVENNLTSYNVGDLQNATQIGGETSLGTASGVNPSNDMRDQPNKTSIDVGNKEKNDSEIENQVVPSIMGEDKSIESSKKEVSINQVSSASTKADDTFDTNTISQDPEELSDSKVTTSASISVTQPTITIADKETIANSNSLENEISSTNILSGTTTARTSTSSRTSAPSSTIITTQRTTRRPGGLFNRIPNRRRSTTSQPTTLGTTITTTTTTTSTTTTQPPTTIAKRRFNPFLRNVFNRG